MQKGLTYQRLRRVTCTARSQQMWLETMLKMKSEAGQPRQACACEFQRSARGLASGASTCRSFCHRWCHARACSPLFPCNSRAPVPCSSHDQLSCHIYSSSLPEAKVQQPATFAQTKSITAASSTSSNTSSTAPDSAEEHPGAAAASRATWSARPYPSLHTSFPPPPPPRSSAPTSRTSRY